MTKLLAVGNPRGCLGVPGTPLPKILKILARYGGVPRGSLTPPYRVYHILCETGNGILLRE